MQGHILPPVIPGSVGIYYISKTVMIVTQKDGRFWAKANRIPLCLSITQWDLICFCSKTSKILSNDNNSFWYQPWRATLIENGVKIANWLEPTNLLDSST